MKTVVGEDGPLAGVTIFPHLKEEMLMHVTGVEAQSEVQEMQSRRGPLRPVVAGPLVLR